MSGLNGDVNVNSSQGVDGNEQLHVSFGLDGDLRQGALSNEEIEGDGDRKSVDGEEGDIGCGSEGEDAEEELRDSKESDGHCFNSYRHDAVQLNEFCPGQVTDVFSLHSDIEKIASRDDNIDETHDFEEVTVTEDACNSDGEEEDGICMKITNTEDKGENLHSAIPADISFTNEENQKVFITNVEEEAIKGSLIASIDVRESLRDNEEVRSLKIDEADDVSVNEIPTADENALIWDNQEEILGKSEITTVSPIDFEQKEKLFEITDKNSEKRQWCGDDTPLSSQEKPQELCVSNVDGDLDVSKDLQETTKEDLKFGENDLRFEDSEDNLLYSRDKGHLGYVLEIGGCETQSSSDFQEGLDSAPTEKLDVQTTEQNILSEGSVADTSVRTSEQDEIESERDGIALVLKPSEEVHEIVPEQKQTNECVADDNVVSDSITELSEMEVTVDCSESQAGDTLDENSPSEQVVNTNQNMNSDDQNDFEMIPPDSGLPFTKYVQHVHALLLSKTESPDSQMGGEQTLMNYLRSKDVKSLKSFLRKNSWGPSHPIRGFLWVKACEHLHKAKGNVYEEFEKELNVQRHSNDLELPAFVDFDNLTSYHLTENGVNTVGRILSIIHHTNPDIIYCPVLFPLIALFLHYMEPSDVYNCAYELLRAKQPFIMQTKVAVEASKAVLKDLTKKFAKSAYVYLVRKCDSIDVVFDRWIWWIFADLPFPYLVRVLDCYLLEGHKILYRVAIAILILFTKYSTKNVTGSNPHRNVAESIRHFCSDMPFSVKKLMKKCFGIRSLTRKEIRKLQVKHEMLLKSRNFLNHEMVKSMSNQSMGMQLTKSFSGPITLNSDSSIIKTDMFHSRIKCRSVGMISFPDHCFDSIIVCHDDLYTIWSWLPARYAVCQPELLYTSEEHGTSLMTLYSLTENHQPTLIFIKTTDDEVFGAFCSTFWGERRRSTKNVSYFGTGETFLFTLAPQKRKYEWVGLTREDVPNTANMFMAGDSSILTVGGGNGEAIQLDANLLHCRTEHCDTFDNDPLCSTEDFTCKVVEVYGFH